MNAFNWIRCNKNPLSLLLLLLFMLFVFSINVFATEINLPDVPSATESPPEEPSGSDSSIEESEPSSSSESSMDNPDSSSASDSSASGPDMSGSSDSAVDEPSSSIAPDSSQAVPSESSQIPKVENALSKEDLQALYEDVHGIRQVSEVLLYIVLPLAVAVLLFVKLCTWFYSTFIKGVL